MLFIQHVAARRQPESTPPAVSRIERGQHCGQFLHSNRRGPVVDRVTAASRVNYETAVRLQIFKGDGIAIPSH
jgi:hypothetical protein